MSVPELSICIPVYNEIMIDTVNMLLKQADQGEINVELVLFDDLSEEWCKEANEPLRKLDRVRYLPLIENVGRSKIRNRMGDYAQGEWLLFMDCDMQPAHDSFLLRYMQQTSHSDVICGGIDFGPKPEDSNLLLRWREEHRVERELNMEMANSSKTIVSTGNFMIKRELFRKVYFNEQLRGYGQEDRLFSYDLSQNKARVAWIENPTTHLKPETNEEFLEKTEQSMINLVRVWNANPNFHAKMREASKRLKWMLVMRNFGLAWLIEKLFHISRGLLKGRLKKGKLPMFFFDFYRWGFLLYAFRQKNLTKLIKRTARV